ncbi:DUF5983 family protein, partial [Escherichia coli]
MMSLWDALRMNMMISYQELVRTFLKRLGLSKTFRRLVITLTRRYGVSLIHLDASAECLSGLPTFNW